jgi:hypothetical protein
MRAIHSLPKEEIKKTNVALLFQILKNDGTLGKFFTDARNISRFGYEEDDFLGFSDEKKIAVVSQIFQALSAKENATTEEKIFRKTVGNLHATSVKLQAIDRAKQDIFLQENIRNNAVYEARKIFAPVKKLAYLQENLPESAEAAIGVLLRDKPESKDAFFHVLTHINEIIIEPTFTLHPTSEEGFLANKLLTEIENSHDESGKAAKIRAYYESKKLDDHVRTPEEEATYALDAAKNIQSNRGFYQRLLQGIKFWFPSMSQDQEKMLLLAYQGELHSAEEKDNDNLRKIMAHSRSAYKLSQSKFTEQPAIWGGIDSDGNSQIDALVTSQTLLKAIEESRRNISSKIEEYAEKNPKLKPNLLTFVEIYLHNKNYSKFELLEDLRAIIPADDKENFVEFLQQIDAAPEQMVNLHLRHSAKDQRGALLNILVLCQTIILRHPEYARTMDANSAVDLVARYKESTENEDSRADYLQKLMKKSTPGASLLANILNAIEYVHDRSGDKVLSGYSDSEIAQKLNLSAADFKALKPFLPHVANVLAAQQKDVKITKSLEELHRHKVAAENKCVNLNIVAGCDHSADLFTAEYFQYIFKGMENTHAVPLLESTESLKNGVIIFSPYIKFRINYILTQIHNSLHDDADRAKFLAEIGAESIEQAVDDLFAKGISARNPAFAHLLKQIPCTIMVGYSDSEREDGLGALIAVERTRNELVSYFRKYGLNIRLFDGRGGDINRGGPAQTNRHHTVQGDEITRRFGSAEKITRSQERSFYAAAREAIELGKISTPTNARELEDIYQTASATEYRQYYEKGKTHHDMMSTALSEMRWFLIFCNSSSRGANRSTKQDTRRHRAADLFERGLAAFPRVAISDQRAITNTQLHEVLGLEMHITAGVFAGIKAMKSKISDDSLLAKHVQQSPVLMDIFQKAAIGLMRTDFSRVRKFIAPKNESDMDKFLKSLEAQHQETVRELANLLQKIYPQAKIFSPIDGKIYLLAPWPKMVQALEEKKENSQPAFDALARFHADLKAGKKISSEEGELLELYNISASIMSGRNLPPEYYESQQRVAEKNIEASKTQLQSRL